METAPADLASRSDPPALAQGRAGTPQVPEITPPPAGGKGAQADRMDADADGISDSLARVLDQADPGEKFDVVVAFDGPGRASERARAVAGPIGIEREFTIINGFQARMTAAQIRVLSAAPGLLRVEENAEFWALDVPSNHDTGVYDARAEYPGSGSGVTVCVVDTGINPDHEQFSLQSLTDADFVDFTPNNLASPYDDNGHGTHVAGILAGDGDGADANLASQALGVAPGVTLKIAKVLDANGGGTKDQVISGIEWCAQHADIISMSLGSGPTDGTDLASLAVNCASDPSYAGCDSGPGAVPRLVVVAAGNSGNEPGTVSAPGVAEYAITAGSFAEWSGDPLDDWQDEGVYLSPFSGRGPVLDGSGAPLWMKPDIAGPGHRVLSAYINSADPALQDPGAYAVASGTSMSTPFISGVIALLLEANPDLGSFDPSDPTDRLPHEKVRDLLAATAVDVGPAGPDNEYGHGLVDALAAVAEAEGLWDETDVTAYPLLPPIAGSVPDHGTWTYPFEVSQGYVDQGLPIAATLTIDGECVLFFGVCAVDYSWWDPDLELVVERDLGDSNWQEVTAASGEVTKSECPAYGDCYSSVGRVEVVHFIPTVAGQYRMRVWPFGGSPNDGTGGTFQFELSMFGASLPDPGSGNTAPEVSIKAPADGSIFPEGDQIDFTGSATDAEDDNATLTSSLSWASDRYGWIDDGASVSTSSLPAGTHVITASVTDSGGLQGQDSITITVASASGATAAHVGDLEDVSTSASGRWDASVAVRVVDNGSPSAGVENATVSGSWSNGTNGGGSCTTGSAGWCTITEPGLKKNVSSVTFTVSGVSHASLTYDSGANADADGDSDGTVINVAQPGTSTNEPPTASFTYECTDLACDFTDTSTDSDGSIASWSWTFGDGNGSILESPSHAYAAGDTYTVELTVTDDSGDKSAPASQSVTVSDGGGSEPPPPEAISLSANGYKVKGEHMIDLSWSGATGTQVDVYLDSAVTDTTANNGSYLHTTSNKGGGTYVFQVCEAGSTTCSNIANVVF